MRNTFYKRILSFSLLFLFCSLASFASAQVSISNISVSSTTPTAGSVIGVTVTYCETANTTPFFIVALNPNSTTMQACPATGQILLVDGCTGNTGSSPVTSSQADASDTCGGNGWAGVGVPNAPPPCPYTQIFNVTIPASLTSGGTYNLIVAAGDYFVQCNNGIKATSSVALTLPLPAASFSLAKAAEGATAAPNGLILFDLDYSVVNSHHFVLSDTVPANTSFVAISQNGSNSGGNLTWNLGDFSSAVTGTAWFLVRVNSGTANGTVINNTASGSTNEQPGPVNSNSVMSTIVVPQLNLTKSESAGTLPAGGSVTYFLDWTATGQGLQDFDSYLNDAAGTSGNSILGYDNTPYTQINGGTFTVATDAQSNNYINANAGGGFPLLLRNAPTMDICQGVTVGGDMEIPANDPPGSDATMVIAYNVNAGVTQAYMLGMSLDNGPGNIFLQKNNGATVTNPMALGASIPVTGVWYSAKAAITYSGGDLIIQGKIWQKGTAEPAAWSVSYTDTAPFPCGESWQSGWQADNTAGTDYYSDLKIFGPGPVVNYNVTDTVPVGVTYTSASLAPVINGSLLSWSVPGTFMSQPSTLSWWGTAACPGPIVNQFAMNADSIAVTSSNSVTLNLTGPCVTSTPTSTPTPNPAALPCSSGTNWSEATAAAAFPCRGNFVSLVYNNKMWVIAGSTSSGVTNDVWSSADGVNWTQVTVSAAFSARFGAAGAVYNNRMWVMGGSTGASEVWSSADGINWTLATGAAPWGPRHHHAVLVFDNGTGLKMWVLGGNNGGSQLSDVWSSADGVNWTEATAAAGFGPRESFGSVVYNNKMWVAGGGGACPNGLYPNVWSSPDGATWTETNAAAPFGQNATLKALNFNNEMWLVGGDQCGTALPNYVWTSTDGITWTVPAGTSIFPSRNFQGAVVYNNAMWVIAGDASGGGACLSDVWYSTCNPNPTPTPTLTPSPTATPALSPTPTLSPTVTSTPTVSPTPPAATPTATPIPPILLWPNPFNPNYAVDVSPYGRVLQVSGLPVGASVAFYTVAGEKVAGPITPGAPGQNAVWDGTNSKGRRVSSGIYFYVVQSGTKVLLTGKLIFLNN